MLLPVGGVPELPVRTRSTGSRWHSRRLHELGLSLEPR